ncbi:unnamed protein product [Mucor fragilis]
MPIIIAFMSSYKHRENKGSNYSNRNQANDFIARAVIGRTNTDEPYKLANTSTKKQRKKARKRFLREPQKRQLRVQDDQRRTVVAYGDASIQATMKKHTPIPAKKVQKALPNKAIGIPTDEFSYVCLLLHCIFMLSCISRDHRKKMRRVPTSRIRQDDTQNTRAVRFCLDDKGNFAHKTSLCQVRARPQRVFPVYALKLCQQCPENDVEDIINLEQGHQWWPQHKDHFNSIHCINYNLALRPSEISRVRRRQEDNEA